MPLLGKPVKPSKTKYLNLVTHKIVDTIFITGCATLPDPIFGSVSQTGTIVGAMAEYSCKSGYQLIGSQSRVCSMAGKWDGTEPVCELVGESSMFFNPLL